MSDTPGVCTVCGLPTHWQFKGEWICYWCEKTREEKEKELNLKDCPICGKKMRRSGSYVLHKDASGCVLSLYGIPITDDLMWNNRPIETELQAEIDRLRE